MNLLNLTIITTNLFLSNVLANDEPWNESHAPTVCKNQNPKRLLYPLGAQVISFLRNTKFSKNHCEDAKVLIRDICEFSRPNQYLYTSVRVINKDSFMDHNIHIYMNKNRIGLSRRSKLKELIVNENSLIFVGEYRIGKFGNSNFKMIIQKDQNGNLKSITSNEFKAPNLFKNEYQICE
jgi:hypothetical protein